MEANTVETTQRDMRPMQLYKCKGCGEGWFERVPEGKHIPGPIWVECRKCVANEITDMFITKAQPTK